MVDFFQLYPNIDAYMDGHILSVDSQYRGKGLGKKLMDAMSDLAKKKKVKVVRAFCSSRFTYQICTKIGYKLVAEIPYRDINIDPLPRVPVPEPHSNAYVLAKEV